jgi:hypothetical protein
VIRLSAEAPTNVEEPEGPADVVDEPGDAAEVRSDHAERAPEADAAAQVLPVLPTDPAPPLPPLRDHRRGSGAISRVLFFAAGADRELLVSSTWKAPYYNRWDIPYFWGIGGAVFVTAVIAAFAVTFALAFALNHGRDLTHYGVVGLIVGVAVFNIDRLLVSDPDVGWSAHGGPGQRAGAFASNLLSELIKLLPRLAITAAIGFFSAEFLLLAFYAPDISNRMRAGYLISVDRAVELSLNQQILAYNNAVEDLNSIRRGGRIEKIDPKLARQIATQRQVITNEEQGKYGFGPTCGFRCNGDVGVLHDYEQTKAEELKQYRADHAAQQRRDQAIVRLTRATVQLSQSQARQIGERACQRQFADFEFPDHQPMLPVPPPVGIPRGARLTISCPVPSYGLNDQINGLHDLETPLQNRSLQPVVVTGAHKGASLPEAASTPVPAAMPRSHVNSTALLIRGSLIGIDILPVLIKFLRALFRRRGYYLMLEARQEEVDRQATLIKGTAARDEETEREIRERAADVRRRLANVEKERQLRTVSDARTRLGLRRIEVFIQDMLRRESEHDRHSATRPPVTPPWARRPPRASGWTRVESPEDARPRESPDDPRSMFD